MILKPSEPPPVQNDDEVLACPICGVQQPGISERLLRTVVKRKGRYVAVIDGETMRCIKCGGVWSYGYRSGVFDRHHASPASAPAEQRQEFDKPPPVTRLVPRERKAQV